MDGIFPKQKRFSPNLLRNLDFIFSYLRVLWKQARIFEEMEKSLLRWTNLEELWSIPISVGGVFFRPHEWLPSSSFPETNYWYEGWTSAIIARMRNERLIAVWGWWLFVLFYRGKAWEGKPGHVFFFFFFFCSNNLSPSLSVSYLFSIFLKLFSAMNLLM